MCENLRQSESSCERRRRAQKLKSDLEDGLQLWSQQVQEVQEHNMRRAEEQVQEERSRKQERAGRERRSRSRRVSERRKESKEREERERKERQQAIEKKAQRVENFFATREA